MIYCFVGKIKDLQKDLFLKFGENDNIPIIDLINKKNIKK